MPFKIFFDIPDNYKNQHEFYSQGGSPRLLHHLTTCIESQKNQIEEINLSWYLYNNPAFHQYLLKLSERGIVINVISIPPAGYDNNNEKTLVDYYSGKKTIQSFTKYRLAREIYGSSYRDEDHSFFNLYCFPHLYVRSENIKKFSRGTFPYSLHIKSIYIKKKSGFVSVISSSNLAGRDLAKYDSLLWIEDEKSYEEPFKFFFHDLIKNSIPIKSYKKEYDVTNNTMDLCDHHYNQAALITAPFYFDSSFTFEQSLNTLLSSAKKRIIICAQHLAAYNYSFNHTFHSKLQKKELRTGILGTAIQRANKGISLICLSQTFSSAQEKFKHIRFRKPINNRHFQCFFEDLSQTKNTAYYVNENIHAKYIIVDDLLIFCTANFTPTQFIYLDQVKIEKFREMPSQSYEGIHCEVSAQVLVSDQDIVNEFLNFTDFIMKHKETHKVL